MSEYSDWKLLSASLEGGVKGLLTELIDGTIEELDGPIRLTAARLSQAAQLNKPALVAECRDQLALIVLEKKLRLKSGGSVGLNVLLSVGLNALFNGAIAGLGALRPR